MTDKEQLERRTPVLGCIADDVTGATDLASNLTLGGMRVVQVLGVPSASSLAKCDADAIVVALKTRSIPIEAAVGQSLQSLRALQEIGVSRFFFKYCSTFDSTEQGNIGPVSEALSAELGVKRTIFCPAFPINGRTVFSGHLFVNGKLLNESGMENHPLNPMTDANLVRFLGQQVYCEVGLLSHESLDSVESVRAKLQDMGDAEPFVICDAINEAHLKTLAHAVADMKLTTGGSGIARYLPEAYRNSGHLSSATYTPSMPSADGRSLILSGSCSAATNAQVAWMSDRCPGREVDVQAIMQDPTAYANQLVAWAIAIPADAPVLIYSTAKPDKVARLQQEFGAANVANAVEQCMATVAERLVVGHDFRRLVLAGGETSGAVVNRLSIHALEIGPEICPGVPWTQSVGGKTVAEPAIGPVALALKSGNFGDDRFFETALEMLP